MGYDADQALDYFHAAKVPKTAAQSVDAITESPAFQAAAAACAVARNVARREHRTRDLLGLRVSPFTPELVARTDSGSHMIVLQLLQGRARRLTALLQGEDTKVFYSLPEHRSVLALINLEEELLAEAELAEGV